MEQVAPYQHQYFANLIKSKDLSKSCKEANNFMEKYCKNSLHTGEQDFINGGQDQ